MTVVSDGSATDTTVKDSGWLRISSGGSAMNTTVSGGFMYVYDGVNYSIDRVNGKSIWWFQVHQVMMTVRQRR